MPIFVKCPFCRVSLRIPSKVVKRGKDIHCPRCKSPVSVFQGIEYNPKPGEQSGPGKKDNGSGDLVSLPHIEPKKPPKRRPKPDADAKSRRRRRDRQAPEPAGPGPVAPRAERRPKSASPPMKFEEVIDVLEVAPNSADSVGSLPALHRPSHADEDEGDGDGDSGRGNRRQQLEKARSGVNFVYIASCLLLASAATALFARLAGGILAVSGAAAAGVTVALILLAVAGLCSVGAVVLAVVGQVICCFSPPRQNAPLLAVLALVCSGAAVLLGLAGVPLLATGVGVPLVLIASGFGVAHVFLFLFFVRALALAIRTKALAASFRNLVIAYAVTIVVYPLLLWIASAIDGTPFGAVAVTRSPTTLGGAGTAGIVVQLLGFAVSLTLFVWFERGLQELKDTLDSRLGWRLSYGTPLWIMLTGAVGAMFVLNLVFSLIMYVVNRSPESPKPKEAEPGLEAPAPPPPPGQMPGGK